jgi:hypothetical protein
MDELYKKLLMHDDEWCDWMGFFNPYTDPFNKSFTRKLPMFDKRAYHANPKYNFVYDKLWVCQSQGIDSGRLETITPTSNIQYPIFIKPRWGHKSASSKNCFKITSYDELKNYRHLDEMMWSTYIEGTENMTDYVLVNGHIVYQITYLYSDEQHGFIESYKLISPENQPPSHITDWVNTHLTGYTGVVNVQYRGEGIIEVGLRLARGGAYIQSTNNDHIIDLINEVYDTGTFTPRSPEMYHFTPFYSFKCFTRIPILYLFPQYIVDMVMYIFGSKPFYEYYFEPNGKDGCVFFQFLHEKKSIGQLCVLVWTLLFVIAQFAILGTFGYLLYSFFQAKKKMRSTLKMWVYIWIAVYLTQYLNPISVQFNLYKAKKQKTFF